MNPERWRQIADVFQSALRRNTAERGAFLAEACVGDEELQREVEALLSSHECASRFMDEPAIAVAAKSIASSSLTGQTVAHYQVLSLLGSGGMGDVYLALDMELGRKVALKLLPDYLASDQQRISRLLQEARVASNLNHPNIAHVYEIGDAHGISFIAMEYIEGQVLSARISGRPLNSTDIVEFGIQIADALEEAHAKGITHRDIKPSNIIISTRNQVKLLDFGLAKVARGAEYNPASEMTTQVKTTPGVIIGTVQYMSPEQALGHEVDHRTDIFSLGVVLYELATGRLPFTGKTATEIIDRIVHAQPEAITRLNYAVPADLERIIRKCLEKDRGHRYQSTRELLIDLKNLERDSKVAGTTPRKKHRVAKAIDSLAVLPLINVSADPDMEYLSDGITESIINSLSQLPKLRVMARGTVFRYKGKEIDPREVGNALRVRVVLAGRVLQVGDRVVIRTELVDAADGSQLWGEQYNRKLSDILVVQEDIALEVAEKLRLKLSRGDKKRIAKRYTENTEAYQLYLKGRYFWNKAMTPEIEKGLKHFQQAIDIDPGYALAYTGLADCYALLSNFSALPPTDVFPKAKAAVVKALELDEMLAEAHTSLAYINTIYDWDWRGAETEFKRAIELKSSDEWSHEAYGWYLAAMERFDESIAEMKRAREVDPLSLPAIAHVGIPLHYARRYDDAIRHFQEALEMDPGCGYVRFRLGLAYVQKGMYEEAIAELQQVLSASGDRDAQAALGYVYALSNQRDKALGALTELQERAKQEYIPSYDIAIIHVGLGETAQAFDWLEKAYEERCYWLTFLRVDPILDSLRVDTKYVGLLRRMKLVA